MTTKPITFAKVKMAKSGLIKGGKVHVSSIGHYIVDGIGSVEISRSGKVYRTRDGYFVGHIVVAY